MHIASATMKQLLEENLTFPSLSLATKSVQGPPNTPVDMMDVVEGLTVRQDWKGRIKGT